MYLEPVHLTDEDRAALDGLRGEANRLAMELVVAVGETQGAPFLIDVEMAHIDACLFHGYAGLDFAEELVRGGGRVGVPTTLNVSSLDLLHPELYRGDAATAAAARRLMDAYVQLGCQATWTCAPYQLAHRPAFGQQIAWGESNAIVFANSVLGARTNRYGDFMDICCALTGRAPFTGLHTDGGRKATLQLDVDIPDQNEMAEVLYPLLGHVLGRVAGNQVAVIEGLDPATANEDRLKALGAAAASSGAVAMFHATGITPEAPTLDAALGGSTPRETVSVGMNDLRRARDELSSGSGSLTAVSVGTPHMSLSELRSLSELASGRVAKLPFFVNTARDTLTQAESEGLVATIDAFGATIVTDTCTYITPIIETKEGVVLTNSGKWAYYAPANLGVGVAFGSLATCVESAVAGRLTEVGPVL